MYLYARKARAIASHFWKRSISCVITGQLSKLCCANALYRAIENLDAIALQKSLQISILQRFSGIL
jgi:hypothetical protein